MATKDFKPFYFDYKGTIFHKENNWTYNYYETKEKTKSIILPAR